MERTPFLAHIAEDGRLQTLVEHLTGTSLLAKEFARHFGAEEQGEFTGLLHDIGKYSEAFQKRLRGDKARVDHSTAGAVECIHRRQPLCAFAVAGHHGGLPEGGSQADRPDEGTFWARIKRGEQGRLEPYDLWKEEIRLPSPGSPGPMEREPSALMFYIRMLYSCLVDADYLDSEAFMVGHGRQPIGSQSIEELWEKLQSYISGWFPPEKELNQRRCAVLERCIQEGMRQPMGLFSLTVPTGGGKTVSSLAFGLAHARARGLRRIIYVVPYMSIIEQTVAVFRSILGKENVLEHHSGALYDLEEEADARTIQLAQATENWDMPVIVTTAVQFFESLYACRPSQCRKLHNIAGSVVVFDEAQMIPIAYLRPCVHAISQLVAHYRVSAVLCTATQPALEPIFREFLPGTAMVELCPAEAQRWEVFRRVTFQQRGTLSRNELAGLLQGHSQVLCIVNTRKSAQELYRQLEEEGRFHLSTLMCPAHRRAKLKEIRNRLSDGSVCRVVSTSLIEAGVNIDFPVVYREIAGLDSILQAAGRCNRESKKSAEESVVNIFQGEERTPPLFATAVGISREILARYADIASQEAIDEYFHQLLDLKGVEAQDVKDILPIMQAEFFPFRTVAERFHLIDSPTRTVYVPYAEGEELIKCLRSGMRSRNLFRKLGQYGVSIYDGHFSALEEAGDLEILEDGTAILRDMELYSEETGLSLEADAGKALFI
ncbi:MAG TPA: CRISPR-associated helicase Cas3' [Candidatus Pullichristensenella excrementigallinarum]|uniref:CRISPR-associated helicase Cas3 n=1 Tax=Candidatus Pullichristensenella excrementigallinarum TaxID=2840907 RepID=A0A9D1IC66_9FIRM|nr:CRISPR-associated helicase Cas3' [Candidatus Pullichristensenella excrementigallinarum]